MEIVKSIDISNGWKITDRRKIKALILYLRAVWEVAKDEYDLFNETALKYARESLECDKDIPAVYHIIGRLTSPDTSEYEKIKKDLKKQCGLYIFTGN